MYRDMSLTLPEGELDDLIPLDTLLMDYLAPEDVEYKCGKCECTTATIHHKLKQLPSMIILHLKRFSIRGDTYVKRSDAIDIPLELKLPADPAVDFTLSGIVSHLGGDMKRGHYVFDKMEDGEWTCYDDSQVSSATNRNVERMTSAYILMYVRK